MAPCISYTYLIDRIHRTSFSNTGLKSKTVDLGDGTMIHAWVPKKLKPQKPNLVLIPGFGANAMWQWDGIISKFTSKFNVYAPDLIFFGGSYTTCPDRTEGFQAKSLMAALKSWGVRNMSLVGLSYGGFVAYSMAAQFVEEVERIVLVGGGVCFEEKDYMEAGMLVAKDLDETMSILMPQTLDKLKELLKITFHKPINNMPKCVLNDYINVMNTKNLQERKELIETLRKGRKLSDLPKICQPTLNIWGEYDRIFPIEVAQRLVRYLDDKPQLAIIQKTGHAVMAENPKMMCAHIKKFLASPVSKPN